MADDFRRKQLQVCLCCHNSHLPVLLDFLLCSPQLVGYYLKKTTRTSTNTHGGVRRTLYPDSVHRLICALLWDYVKENPCGTLKWFASKITEFGFPVNVFYIQRIFKKWRWVHKKASRVQIHKYTKANIIRYINFVVGVWEIPWRRLKFLDECHFVPRDLQRRMGWGESGEPLIVVSKTPLDSSISLTLMTTLDNNPETNPDALVVVVDARESSNTQWDFLQFVVTAIERRHLVSGM